eukprot:TRINITY_DN10116_c0_g1_i1.p1 TRINITY_DN10116_c0_g1~~TRINITY_DN10116_c0_g1_i1.p1  ORF type:complete len:152 (-),score=52.95 TRINITY_DN10116_c0_g1_i1:93-488(-)
MCIRDRWYQRRVHGDNIKMKSVVIFAIALAFVAVAFATLPKETKRPSSIRRFICGTKTKLQQLRKSGNQVEKSFIVLGPVSAALAVAAKIKREFDDEKAHRDAPRVHAEMERKESDELAKFVRDELKRQGK